MLAYIIIAIIILGILGSVKTWFDKNKNVIAIIVGIVICILMLGFKETLVIVASIVGVGGVFKAIVSYIQQKNEAALKRYLSNNCIFCGYITTKDWERMLPQFVNRMYETSFENVTSEFSKQIEKQYIENDSKLTWLDPIVLYLTDNVMADIIELERVPSGNLRYTHSTPNGQLIYDAMEYLCKAKVVEGKHMIQKIILEDSAIRKELKLTGDMDFPEYYKTAYKINDYFIEKRKNNVEGNIESEEISIDDL